MSYSGSHHQFGHSESQLLQNRVMVTQLQELQKHQHHGQIGDVNSQSPITAHYSRFGKHGSGGQIPNFSGGPAVNSSDIFAANSMSWMHHNISSPMQGFSSNSCLHDQGLMMYPSLQEPDVSLHGMPVTSGRADMGHYSPVHGIGQSSIGTSVDSAQKHIPQASPYANFLLNYSGMHGQPSGTELLHEKNKKSNESGETAGLDPLEEKILFDTDNSGWDSSLSKLAALDTEEYANSSRVTETTNPFSTVHGRSWSALMQSAVAEVSSSDNGVHEELSGLSYQNINQPSNIVTNTPRHFKCNHIRSESSSCNLNAPPSSCDSVMSSALPNFQQIGLQSSFELGLNKFSSDINIESWSNLAQSLQTQQQSNQHVFVGSGSSVGNRNIYGQIQHQTSGHQYMSTVDGTLNQKEYENESPRYDGSALKNGPMGIDATSKNEARTYASRNNQGENSSDSYNSKVSHAYTAQPDHACLYAADSESSARSSQKSPNQALCVSSPRADSQQECFNSIKSDNVLHTNSDFAIQGKHNQSEDALSKCSPASNICALLDSKNTPKHNKGSLVSDHGGTTQDIFSFQSSVFGDSVPANFGNKQKGQTWWMPSSFGHSVPPLQGALAQKWCTRSSNLGNLGFEISNLKSERLSHGSIFPGPSCATNQLERKSMSDTSVPSESMSKKAEMGQQVSLPNISHLNQHSVEPHFVQMSMSGQGDVTVVDPREVSYNLHNFSTPYFSGKDQSSLVDPSARNSEIAINGEGQFDKVRFNEKNYSQNQSSGNNGYDVISNLSSVAQIASSLYKQYEGTNNAQIRSPFDASKVSSSVHTESFMANQMVTHQQVVASSMLPGNADNMNLILSKSRKRKLSKYDGLPWHVDVMQKSWKLPDISVAEQVWAKATNRLVEEILNENNTLEEMHPVTRGKKRLILTSQLIQQVFQPPRSSILRDNATFDYELVAYFVAKVALADTCKLMSKTRIHIPRAHGDMLINASPNGLNSLVNDVEVLVERAMKLESQIEGLNGLLSIVDIRLECQELEKFSLINHFAKYHGQLTQSNATDTQSPFLQRYINPTPLPQKFPEETKCLSL